MTYSPSARKRLRTRTRTARGFTLIEMMVVVAIIAMMAALAAPSVINIIRDNRSQKDALSLLVMVQDAHSRAYGRGGAVILTYNEGTPDTIDIQERMQDIDADGKGDLPWVSCETGVLSPVLKYWQTSDPEQPTDVELTMNGQGGIGTLAGGDSQGFCFQPRGGSKAFLPVVPAPPPPAKPVIWQNLTDVATFQFTAAATTKQRFVLVYPNGSFRLR